MKKNFLQILIFFLPLLYAGQLSAQTYCMPTFTSGCSIGDQILNFSTSMGIANITNNNSLCNGTAPNYTTYFSNMTVSQVVGQSFNISVQAGPTYGQGFRIWVDWNQNGSFGDPGENVWNSGTSSLNVYTGTITIPPTALPGLTRMRVMCQYVTVPAATDYCLTNITYGEVEDYNVLVIAPVPTVTGDGVYCQGDNVVLTASVSSTIVNPILWWTLPDGSNVIGPTVTINNIQVYQAGNYYVRTIGRLYPGGPVDTTDPAIANVTVNSTPGKPVVSPNITYCQGDAFDSIQVYGEHLKWYSVPTGGVAGPYPNIDTYQPGTVTYYVSQTVEGCEGPRAPVTLSVAPKPAPPQVTSPVGYCQGVASSALVAQGQNVRWYSTASGGVGTPIAPTPSTAAQGTFTWYATQTIAGCESERVAVEVNVSYLPNGLITLSRDFVCQYDTISIGYFGNALPSADYTWTLPAGATVISGNNEGPLVVRFDSAGMMRVSLVVDNNGCIGPVAYYDVPVHLSPRITIDVPENACAGDIVNLSITHSSPGIDSFRWDFAGAEVVYGAVPRGPYGLRWDDGGLKTVRVEVESNSCRSLPETDDINIRWLPSAEITASRSDICVGDSVEFSVASEPGGSYQWLPHQFFGESNSSRTWGVVTLAREIEVKVTSIYNCKSTGKLWLGAHSCCEVYFPTAFSPNGDGRNDIFRMLTVNKDKNAQTRSHQITSFRVVNRWGQTVFETGDETTGWDGTFNGRPQDMGTYYFYVKYKCADGNFYEEKGEVTLIR